MEHGVVTQSLLLLIRYASLLNKRLESSKNKKVRDIFHCANTLNSH